MPIDQSSGINRRPGLSLLYRLIIFLTAQTKSERRQTIFRFCRFSLRFGSFSKSRKKWWQLWLPSFEITASESLFKTQTFGRSRSRDFSLKINELQKTLLPNLEKKNWRSVSQFGKNACSCFFSSIHCGFWFWEVPHVSCQIRNVKLRKTVKNTSLISYAKNQKKTTQCFTVHTFTLVISGAFKSFYKSQRLKTLKKCLILQVTVV